MDGSSREAWFVGLAIAVAVLMSAMVDSWLSGPKEPMILPCPVPVWEEPPANLDEMEARTAKAREMMEECARKRAELAGSMRQRG